MPSSLLAASILVFCSRNAVATLPTTPAKLPSPTALRPLVNPPTADAAASAPVISLFKPKAAGSAASATPPIALVALSINPVSADLAAPPVVAPGLALWPFATAAASLS